MTTTIADGPRKNVQPAGYVCRHRRAGCRPGGYPGPSGQDRTFPAAWVRRHARERLGIEADEIDEIDGGHYIALARPQELADRLVEYAAAV